jgi:hypothetical protein
MADYSATVKDIDMLTEYMYGRPSDAQFPDGLQRPASSK